MRRAILFLFLCALPGMGQEVVEYVTILEGDTLPGFYEDLEIKNGDFASYAILECPDKPYLKYPNATNNRQWILLLRGAFRNGTPSDQWTYSITSLSCECQGDLGWRRIKYLENDSMEVSNWQSTRVMTSDTSYVRGFLNDGIHHPAWECIDHQCKVWINGKSDTVPIAFWELQMVIDTQEWRALFRSKNLD